eukprot:TRINITY_DN2886_c0_g1_i2.p2 TRINITY_DN2886_c0_g1~~TRINITY_DN2886_c0_g1_i2.p2  ORF type:complete len:127 (-),score=22.44 TRINITY_DN2886_c0_g1_i2:86-466(-)
MESNRQRQMGLKHRCTNTLSRLFPPLTFFLSTQEVKTNQFSVTEHYRPLSLDASQGLPGVFVMYDLSPIMVVTTEHRSPLSHFLASVCAIVGGVFTVSSIVDSIVYHTTKKSLRQSASSSASAKGY